MDWIKEQLEEAYLDENRIIGSVECVPERLVTIVVERLREKGFKTEIVKTPSNDFTVVYYQDCPEEILQLYRKYEESDGDVQVLTAEGHRKLGRAFGYSEEEIEWFVEEFLGCE